MGELILQVQVSPSQDNLEKYVSVKNETIENPQSEFEDSMRRHNQTITDTHRTANEHTVDSFVVCIPPQLNQNSNVDSPVPENESPSSVTISMIEQNLENKPPDEIPKNPPRKRKEVVYEPPPYEIIPPQRPKYKSPSFDDLPPPYDPTLRRTMISIISLDNEILNHEISSNEQSCNLSFLMQFGCCFCSLEQLIVTIAIIGTFIFLGFSY
ncbi:hypothetical protein WA026_001387 [Henosepilachna vigintioctopunctata]|uniref:Uncharacterized protein n=1 Tax=Henosepilachna vigintioctopunctata TaxID=420089 RepID=A0AAW1UL07_9CUCU